jgi:hypothetical protein
MIKCLLIAGIAFASAVFAFDDAVCLVPVGNTGATPTSTAYIPTPSDGRDVIYDDQAYGQGTTEGGFSIYGAMNWEPADDFETTDGWVLEIVRFWLFWTGNQDIRVDIFSDSGGQPGSDPPGDLFNEEVLEGDITWTYTGDSMFGYPIYEVDIPITGFYITAGTRYWLGLQSTSGDNSFWLHMYHDPDWWEECYWYYEEIWYSSGDWIHGDEVDCEFELYGTPGDDVDPDVTQTFPHDSDFPSGVPVDTIVTFHVTDDVTGCDAEATTISVEQGGGQLSGIIKWDDSDSLDVAFKWKPDDHYAEGTGVDVTVETYDLAGNGPVTESWLFTTGYVNVAPASLGVIKAGFVE